MAGPKFKENDSNEAYALVEVLHSMAYCHVKRRMRQKWSCRPECKGIMTLLVLWQYCAFIKKTCERDSFIWFFFLLRAWFWYFKHFLWFLCSVTLTRHIWYLYCTGELLIAHEKFEMFCNICLYILHAFRRNLDIIWMIF